MGNASVYATSPNGHYVYADISWDSSLNVSVTITDVNAGWCIKIRGTSTIKCSGSMSNRTASFTGVEGQDYILQVYDTVEGCYYNDGNTIFTVSNDSGGSGGGSSGDDDDGYWEEDEEEPKYYLYISVDTGTSDIEVKKTWDQKNQTGYSLSDAPLMYNGSIINTGDWFYISVIAKEGYDFNDTVYTIDGESYSLPFSLTNLTPSVSSGYFEYRVVEAGNAYITTTTEPIKYELSIPTINHATISVFREYTEHSTAVDGVELTSINAIYHFDTLKISCAVDDGYTLQNIYVNGTPISNGDVYDVSGDVSISVDITPSNGVVYIDNGTESSPYQCHIDNGSDWDLYIPYIDNGFSWEPCN